MLLVNIDFTIWTGRVKADTPATGDLCTAGSIKIFDAAYLNPFRNFKTRAEQSAASYGLKFMGGWLVDGANMRKLEEALGDCHSAWANALAAFVLAYPRRADAWARSHPKWEDVIRQKQPAPDELWQRFAFNWQTFHLSAETTYAVGRGNNTSALVDGLADSALNSVLDSLRTLYVDSFNKDTSPSSKAYNALKKISQRSHALGFVNANAARLAPILLDLSNRKNHALARVVLSRLDSPQGVEAVLQTVAGQGIDSFLEPVEVIQLSPTALEEEKQKQAFDSLAVLDSLGL